MAKTGWGKKLVRVIEKVEKLVCAGKKVKDEIEDLNKPDDDKK